MWVVAVALCWGFASYIVHRARCARALRCELAARTRTYSDPARVYELACCLLLCVFLCPKYFVSRAYACWAHYRLLGLGVMIMSGFLFGRSVLIYDLAKKHLVEQLKYPPSLMKMEYDTDFAIMVSYAYSSSASVVRSCVPLAVCCCYGMV